MNLRLNLLQKMLLFTLREQPWSTPQEVAAKLNITPKLAGSVLKNLQMGKAAEMRQESRLVGVGNQRRTKVIRHYKLTRKGRALSAKVTPEEVTHFTATQSKKEKPVAATASKGEATTREPGRQYTANGHRLLTCEEVMANAEARFAVGEWFTAKGVNASYAVMDELVRRGEVEDGRPGSAATRTFRRPRKG